MQALEELPESDKDELFPFFSLRSWTTAHNLDSALIRLEEAYGDRPLFIDLIEPEFVENRRPVHDQLDMLRNPANGYRAWCNFIEEHPNFVPALQLNDPVQVRAETVRLHALGRGMIVPIPRVPTSFPLVPGIAQSVASSTNQGRDVCFFLDFGRAHGDLIMQQMATSTAITAILNAAPNAFVAISASSFPDTFVSVTEQEIYERALFSGVSMHLNSRRLIYSDRGSARAERQSGGGGGTIPPRIDYAERTRWTFFRADGADARLNSYQAQASRTMNSESWDARLRLWGTQMIERTAIGDNAAIISPAKATAVRINIHLHRQLFYDDPIGVYNTDEEWRD